MEALTPRRQNFNVSAVFSLQARQRFDAVFRFGFPAAGQHPVAFQSISWLIAVSKSAAPVKRAVENKFPAVAMSKLNHGPGLRGIEGMIGVERTECQPVCPMLQQQFRIGK